MSEVRERLALAVQLTRDADAKASGLLSGAGVLAAVAALAAGAVDVSGPVARAGLCVAGTGLITALVVLLATLAPRGGRRPGWVKGADPVDELDRVSQIVRQKHVLLRVAVAALTVAVLAAAVVAAVTVAGTPLAEARPATGGASAQLVGTPDRGPARPDHGRGW